VVDFDVAALYAAVDAERQARGLSWTDTARVIGSISTSTLKGLRTRRVVEGDGVLQILRWLRRSPESFVPGSVDGIGLPDPGPGDILRFDTELIYDALNTRRVEQNLTWREVANEIGDSSVASLTRLAKGGRVAFPSVSRIARWLGRPIASLTYVSPR